MTRSINAVSKTGCDQGKGLYDNTCHMKDQKYVNNEEEDNIY
jgi:hypothetical protein